MPRVVADASVVVKWFIEEAHSDAARRLRDDYAADLIDLDAPCILPFEVMNALHFSSLFTPDELTLAAEALDRFSISLHVLEGELSKATLELARASGVTIYDASYAALTRQLGSEFYTADERLIEALSEVLQARHIREYRTPEG
jgi:predicted nucleic acid-binding protein